MTPPLRALLLVVLVTLFSDFAWDKPWLMAGLT